MGRDTWSENEEAFLIGAFQRGMRPDEVAALLGKDKQQVRNKMYRLGWSIEKIGAGTRTLWSEKDTELLKKGMAEGRSVKEIAASLGKNEKTVYIWMKRLGVKAPLKVCPERYDYASVLCPFFVGFKKNRIIACEGVNVDSLLLMEFTAQKTYEQYIVSFCCGEYKNCLIAKALYNKYEE